MRLLRCLIPGITLVSYALAQELTPDVSAEKHHYQVRLCLYRRGLSCNLIRAIRVMSPVFVRS